MPDDSYPLIQGIQVDIDALRRLAHACAPQNCKWSHSCCRTYEIYVEPKEMQRVVDVMGTAAGYAPNLKEDGDYIDPFDETDGGNCLLTDDHGGCVFAYRGKNSGGVWCSLHSAALELGIPYQEVKPMPCTLWPLFLHETKPPLLTVQSGATSFPCNERRRPAKRPLDDGVADLIRTSFGQQFLDEVQELVAGK